MDHMTRPQRSMDSYIGEDTLKAHTPPRLSPWTSEALSYGSYTGEEALKVLSSARLLTYASCHEQEAGDTVGKETMTLTHVGVRNR